MNAQPADLEYVPEERAIQEFSQGMREAMDAMAQAMALVQDAMRRLRVAHLEHRFAVEASGDTPLKEAARQTLARGAALRKDELLSVKDVIALFDE